MPEYISPSALALWEQDTTAYYLHYLAQNRAPREAQTQPMAIGSAFDAFVKAYLYEGLFGRDDPKYELNTIFEAQVEPAQRDWALGRGKYVFEQYKQSGCLADLMLILGRAAGAPRFEFEIRGAVHGYREGVTATLDEVIFLGKPDVDFTTEGGEHVILDFKVNGFCSKYPKSPAPYYLRMRSAGRTNWGMHKKCRPAWIKDMEINCGCFLEAVDAGWARQLAIYGWLCGEPVGNYFTTIIHQLVCSPSSNGGLPGIKVAEHINRIGDDFQRKVFARAVELWDIIRSDWYFRDMTPEESRGRCELLEKVYGERRGEVDIFSA